MAKGTRKEPPILYSLDSTDENGDLRLRNTYFGDISAWMSITYHGPIRTKGIPGKGNTLLPLSDPRYTISDTPNKSVNPGKEANLIQIGFNAL